MFQQPAPALGHPATAAALASLRADPPLHYAADTPFHAPRTLADLAALRAAKPQARLLAGSTDIGLWVNKQFRDLGEVIYLGEVAELKAITVADGVLTIGAGASLQSCLGRAGHPLAGHPGNGPALRIFASARRPAPWAAMWPMDHPSATVRRC
jgi:xanthine dehydrogenase small subunit